MSLKQPGFSNQGGTINVSGAFSADLGTLDNTGGTLHAGSLNVATSGDLINVDGTLTSDSDASLQVGGKVDNMRGTLSAQGRMSGIVVGATDNTSGNIAANNSLQWSAASLTNDEGNVGSANGSAQLNVTGAITNGQGSLGAGTDLQIQAGSLSNAQGGSVRAEGNIQLSTSGAVTNDGAITAAGNTAITAGSVSAGTSSVMGAGINKDGTLAASGDLTITASSTLTANGTNLAAGGLALQGSSVDVSHSTTSASNVSLNATNGNVDTSAAKVVTPGTLTITADANAAQSLVNTGGTLNAGQLQINAANISNTVGGQLVQTGTAATTIAVSGTLDNSGSVIAANSQDLSLSATSLVNAGGQIAHAGTGTLTLSGGSFDGAGGEVASNGALAVSLTGAFNQDGGTTSATAISIDAGSLSNKAGQIVQTGTGATHIGVSGALDNTNGAIASNGQTAVTAGTLTNGGGQIRTAGSASLSLTTNASLSAGGDLTARAATLAAGDRLMGQNLQMLAQQPGMGWITAEDAPWQQVLIHNVGDRVAGALVSTALNGGDLERNLGNAIATGLLDTVASTSANWIGGATSGNALANAIAHAVAGCVVGAGRAAAGAGTSTSKGCSAGALGAVVGELAAGAAQNQLMSPGEIVNMSQGLAGIAGALVTGDSAGANIASQAGANAAQNNRILHPDDVSMAAALAGKGPYSEAEILDAMRWSNGRNTNGTVSPATQQAYGMDGTSLGANSPTRTLSGDLSSDPGLRVVPTGNSASSASFQEALPSAPSRDLMNFITASTGGSSSPYQFNTAGMTYGPPATPAQTQCASAECAAGLAGSQGRGLLPDYVSLNPGVHTLTGASSINSYDGTAYIGGGVSIMNSNPGFGFSTGIAAGYILGVNDASGTNEFLEVRECKLQFQFRFLEDLILPLASIIPMVGRQR
ncbi:beta strand repeat-containing protein [Pseudacidovorax sp. NFM-22]|uniref:beta strand repeat-containing protein n=1 Tax=Pseudacidovorax sp. NFM-22 TaxID=2744469 RepID=UPI001F180464|nr:hypothetical protein [Pseudacidovorax sp. NFM-22]